MYLNSLNDILYLKDIYIQITTFMISIHFIHSIFLINELKTILYFDYGINNLNNYLILFKNYYLYYI